MATTSSLDFSRVLPQMIREYKLAFSDQMLCKICELAYTHCYGCEIDHPSQTRHTCLMMTEMEQFYSYRDEAYELCSKDILTTYEHVIMKLKDLSRDEKHSFLRFLVDKDLTVTKDDAFKMVERMIKLNNRFTS